MSELDLDSLRNDDVASDVAAATDPKQQILIVQALIFRLSEQEKVSGSYSRRTAMRHLYRVQSHLEDIQTGKAEAMPTGGYDPVQQSCLHVGGEVDFKNLEQKFEFAERHSE